MQADQEHIEQVLNDFFNGSISEEDLRYLEEWKNLSPSNRETFSQAEKVWRSLQLLSEMKRYNPQKALQQINQRINEKTSQRWWFIWQRVAAILVVPLLIAAVWLSLRTATVATIAEGPTMQTFTTPPGVKAKFHLPDSTSVWLNSSSSITFPSYFSGDTREVEINGEVFFDVRTNPDKPFLVGLGKLHVRVLGTRFNVINYDQENRSEIVLQSGKVELCSGNIEHLRILSGMMPGELAIFNKTDNSIEIKSVNTEKYLSWINGMLIFKDDPMDEVVRKLNRWFNVEIEIADPSILEYVYTATFQDESVDQILELLTISAPIRYQVIRREKQENGLYSPKRIILRKRS
jgi:transmembrane sensor